MRRFIAQRCFQVILHNNYRYIRFFTSKPMSKRKLMQLEELSTYTSDFTKADLETLRIRYEGTKEFLPKTDKPVPSEVLVSNLDGSSFRECSEKPAIIASLPEDEKTIATLISYVMMNELGKAPRQEVNTNSFVNRLLIMLKLANYPLTLHLQPLYSFKVYNKEISARFDFGITKGANVTMIDEDKHLRGISPSSQWGEYQIAGEILAGLYSNHEETETLNWIYAVRVVGTRFTFYKAKPSEAYMEAITLGPPDKEDLVIYRYPETRDKRRKFPCFDYADPEERKHIAEMLISIREAMLSLPENVEEY